MVSICENVKHILNISKSYLGVVEYLSDLHSKRYQALQVKCSCALGSLLYYVHLTSKGRRKRLKSDEQILSTCLCMLAFLLVKRVRVICGLKVEIALKKERNNLGRLTSCRINFHKSQNLYVTLIYLHVIIYIVL